MYAGAKEEFVQLIESLNGIETVLGKEVTADVLKDLYERAGSAMNQMAGISKYVDGLWFACGHENDEAERMKKNPAAAKELNLLAEPAKRTGHNLYNLSRQSLDYRERMQSAQQKGVGKDIEVLSEASEFCDVMEVRLSYRIKELENIVKALEQ